MTPRRCPYCGATLDPGERCDCLDAEPEFDAAELAAWILGEDGDS